MRKRQQSVSKYRNEKLRTGMKVKERWVVRDKEVVQAVSDEECNVV